MTRKCGSSQPTPHLNPATLRSLRENATAENLKRRAKDGKKGTEHSSERWDRRARELSLPQISEGNGGREKVKRELCRKIETITKCESAGVEGGRVKNLASETPRSRKNVPERYERTPPKRSARAEWTSCPTLRGRRRNRAENYQKNPAGKLNTKSRTKTKQQTSKAGKPDQNTRGQRWPEHPLATSAPRDQCTLLSIPRATDLPRRS